MDNATQPPSEPSLMSLLGGIVHDAKALLMHEVALAKLEARYELRKAKTAAIALGIGIGILAAGGMLLALMLVHMLAALTVIPLWGCYGIVGIGLFALGGTLLFTGKTTAVELESLLQPIKTKRESAQWPTTPTISGKR